MSTEVLDDNMSMEIKKTILPRCEHAPDSLHTAPGNAIDIETYRSDEISHPDLPPTLPAPSTPIITRFMRDLALQHRFSNVGHGHGRFMTKRKFQDDDLEEISENQFKRAYNHSRSFQRSGTGQITGFDHRSELLRQNGSASTTPFATFAEYADIVDLDSDEYPRRPSTATISSQVTSVLDLVESDDDDEVTFISSRTIRQHKKKACPKILGWKRTEVASAIHNGIECRADKFVELKDGTFMKIRTIYRDRSCGHVLIGTAFVRAGCLSLAMPTRRNAMEWKTVGDGNALDTRLPLTYKGNSLVNELVQKIRVGPGEGQADYGLWRRSIQDVVRERDLTLTNSDYENTCLTTKYAQYYLDMENTAPLTCRWKDIVLHDENGKWKEQILERVSEGEADNFTKTQEELEKSWCVRDHAANASVEQPITFADSFCRAGGVSAGAQQAGLTIKYAFDYDENKIATFQVNFNQPGCCSFAMEVSEFIERAKKECFRVDVLHLSPPCQPFSNANTTPNEAKNERNQPPLLGCGEVIRCLRPRVVTVEEAPGIASRHSEWFYALLNQFTELGFSLRWTNLKCADFGVPQQRRRFMIIAAAPGEPLPPFPEPTHGLGDCSVALTLAELEVVGRTHELTHHDTRTMQGLAKPAYDANCLAKTITTSGGDNYHPSGLRQFSIREYASLQTFPWSFEFGRDRDGRKFNVAELRTQIGNAVPPFVSRAVFGSIVKSLREHAKRRMAAG